MNPTVKDLFDAVAGDYDRQRRQLIPCFDDFYGTALTLAECGKPSPRILDLGAGTGLFSGMVLHKHPHAELTLMDISDKMLEGARRRFGERTGVHYVTADYSAGELPGAYDLIVSSLSIHHLTHPDKKRLFASIYRALPEGGIFVNADQVAGRSEAMDAYYRRRWLEQIQASGLEQSAIDASVERRKVDINAKAEDQLLWLEEAGFAETDCVYKNLDFAVFYARKG